jgi:5-(carboxyamino)imidazole ribonucleotide synthase
MIVPPATIGMLGGGQLGRYAVVAARLSGYRTVVVDPDPGAPAGRVADEHLVAAYDDPAALDQLATTCAVVTTEFENPPADALARLATEVLVAPSTRAVAVAQDRRAEKRFLSELGVPVAPFAVVDTTADLEAAGRDVGFPAILKTARLGYDGKGQATVDGVDGLHGAWTRLGAVPCVLEQRLPLDVETSVILARRADGATAVFPLAENHHVAGILDLTRVPANVEVGLTADAADLALSVADALDYVGVLAVELFVSGGRLIVNELAPRPHNSGHWTLDAAAVSQFDQQVRAVCGCALGASTMTAPAAAMVNLLGDLWADGDPDWSVALGDPAARLHLYGKAAPRQGRKMGHLTVVADSTDVAAARALELRRRLTGGPRART